MSHDTVLNSVALESKLLNGVPVYKKPIVYLASIRQHNPNNRWNHFCTGYFASLNIVLTTSSCIIKIKRIFNTHPGDVGVFLGMQIIEPSTILYRIIHLETFADYKARHDVSCSHNIDVGLILVRKY